MENETIKEQKQIKNQQFAEWCILELFGHQQIAGFVTEATIGGCSFLRVDVPNRADQGEGVMYTRLFGNGAIYAVNITTEAEARAAIERLHPKPYVPRVRESAMLPAGAYDEPDDD
jgi:hypothetical protein